MSFLSVTFLAPLALLGLAAVAVPIYLHLRHKPRSETLRFSALAFLLQAQKKRKRRFRMEQWFLMLARLIVISLLAFLFAKPYLEDRLDAFGGGGNRPLVIVFDDSASMLAGGVNDRFFERAQLAAGDLLDSAGGGAPARLIPASNPTLFSERTTVADVRDGLSVLKPNTGRHTLDNAYAEAIRLTGGDTLSSAVIHIFTDGSLSAWSRLPDRKPDQVEVIYHDARETGGSFRNMGVVAVGQPLGDSTNNLEITIQNGTPEYATVDVTIEGDDAFRLRENIGVEGWARASHAFGLGDTMPATLKVELPRDDFELDNQIVFTPRQNKNTRILIVDGDPNPEPVRAESFFLKNALGLNEEGGSLYELEVISASGLNVAKALEYDVLCILNTDVPDSAVIDAVLEADKGVFLAMGSRMDVESWNAYMKRFDLEVWEPKILDGPTPVVVKSYDHPIFQRLSRSEWDAYIQEIGIERMRLMSVGRADVDILFSMPNGEPILISRTAESGRMMIWTSTIDLEWNNFPLQFGFVPFTRNLVDYLAGRGLEASFQSLTVSQVLQDNLIDSLSLKHPVPGFESLDVAGPIPGVYTARDGDQTRFVQVGFDPEELDFRTFQQAAGESTAGADQPLEKIGFRSFSRTDLAPWAQWLLFGFILLETFVAARLTINWGAR